MKLIKKCILLLTAALIAASVGAFAACGGNDGDSSSLGDSSQSSVSASQDSSSSSSSSSSSVQQPVEPDDTLEDDANFVFPEDDETINWLTLDDLSGTGHAYVEGANAPYYGSVGYYEIEFTKKGKENGYTHFNFAVPQSGQYALYTLNDTTGVTIINYPHNPQYVNYATGKETHALKSGKLYCLYNMSDVYFSDDLLIDFAFKCVANTTLKFRFVRVGEPINPPVNVVTDISAKEILGKASKPKYQKGVAVPYESPYFFDETASIEVTPFDGSTPVTVSGFYRMGTPEKPGNLIYAAINAPNRLLSCSFAETYLETNALNINVGADPVTGNYLFNNYRDFITNDKGTCDDEQADLTFACYENAANEDGYYPVNREIYAFLQDYLTQNSPYFGNEYEEGEEPDKSTWWLSVCYQYTDVPMGTSAYPIELKEGTNTIELENDNFGQYYNFVSETGDYYTVSCDAVAGVYININGIPYAAPFALTFETNATEGKTIIFLTEDGSAATFDIQITPFTQSGTYVTPVEINGEGSMQVQPHRIHALEYTDDTPYEIYSVCTVTLTEGNKLTLTASNTDASIVILGGASEEGIYTLITSDEYLTPTAIVRFMVMSTSTEPITLTLSTSTVDVEE